MTVEQLAALATEYFAALDAVRVMQQPYPLSYPVPMTLPNTAFVQATSRLQHAEAAMRAAIVP